MDYKLLFFIKDINYKMDGFGWVALILLILFILTINVAIKEHKKDTKSINSLFIAMLIFFIIIILGLLSYSDYYKYSKLVNIIDTKSYKIIEGKVHSYDTMYKFDKKHESFIINNIRFDYRPAYNTGAFSLIKGEGNPIEEGSLVRLWYFQQKESQTNLILKFEYIP